MKKFNFTLAVLALVAASCTKNEPVEQPQPRILRVSATVEEPAAPRATLETLAVGLRRKCRRAAPFGFSVGQAGGCLLRR